VTNQSQADRADTPADPEVVERAQQRQFSQAEKQRILAEADACREAGAIGALLRWEEIYSSYLTQWRRERAAGLFGEKAPALAGPR
jgi:transposase-like protein